MKLVKRIKATLAAFGNITYENGAWELGLGLRVDRWESEEEAVDIGHSASKDDVEVLPKLISNAELSEMTPWHI